jgi:hypothetical protein
LDVLIRHKPSMEHTTVGRSFYTPQGSRPLSGGVEVWQGYYQSARPTPRKSVGRICNYSNFSLGNTYTSLFVIDRMMINIDLSATAFYEGGSLIDMITKILNKRNPDELRRGLSDRDRVKVEKAIKNLKICVIHRGETTKKRRFKVMKLTSSPASHTKFDAGEMGTMDVASYFYRQYNTRLSFASLPCVVVRKDIFLPMEVCEVINVSKDN